MNEKLCYLLQQYKKEVRGKFCELTIHKCVRPTNFLFILPRMFSSCFFVATKIG
jgi:hypothetical protein